MSEFTNFNDWCQYWSKEYDQNITKWHSIVNTAIDNNDESNQYLFGVEFHTISDGEKAMHDLCLYGKDHGNPENDVDNEYSDKYWRVFLTCRNVPLVIRMANNHRGSIDWWNSKFLKSPPQNIPYYIPSKPKQTTSQKTDTGCYIATAVYGSYDCPEVWTLRRYRDGVLDNSWYGRLFIRCYYSVSPTLVKCFGRTKWFRNLLRNPLNKWVDKLNKQGFEDTPYTDR